MGQRTNVEVLSFLFFSPPVWIAKRFGLLLAEPRGCGTCWGLLHNEDKPSTRPAVPYTRKAQEWEPHEWLSLCDNDCGARRERTVRGPRRGRGRGQGGPRIRTWDRVRARAGLRNYPGMWRYVPQTKNLSRIQQERSPPRLLARDIAIPSKGLACEPRWTELMEVLCTGLGSLEEF